MSIKISADHWDLSPNAPGVEIICYSRITTIIPGYLLDDFHEDTYRWYFFPAGFYLGRRRNFSGYNDKDLWWVPGNDFLYLGKMEYGRPIVKEYAPQ